MMSQLETCDLCHEIKPLRKIHFDGVQFLCERCRKADQIVCESVREE